MNVWRWNSGGLGHSHSGYAGPFNDIAITQDGKINASMILTGALSANIITAGVLKDANSKVVFDLDAGTLAITKGSINLGSGNFIVTDAGALTAKSGKIAAFDFTTSGFSYTAGSAAATINSSDITYKSSTRRLKANAYRIEIGRMSSGNYSYLGALDGYDTSGIWLCGKKVYIAPRANEDAAAIASLTVDSNGDVSIDGNFIVASAYSKSKECDTENYNKRLQYCYETPTPLFGDIGEAVLDEDGICYVDLDDIFTETIAERVEYQVFLQKEGPGDCWIADKTPKYFVINGTPGLKIAWELKAKQKNFENIRLELSESRLDEYDRTSDINISLDDYINEQEELLYG